MKIILIGTIASSFYGFRKDLIEMLVLKNYKIYAFFSEYNLGDLEKIRALGVIPIIYNLNRGGLNPFSDIKTIYQLTNKIRTIQPDLVFSFFVKPVIFGTLAARLVKVSHVIGMLEGLGYSFTEQPEGLSIKAKLIKNIQVFLYRLSLPKLDRLIFLNTDDQKDLLDRYQIKVKQVGILGGIGLNLENYPYSPIFINNKEVVKFLFIGRLLREKGIHEFISASKIVKEMFPNTIFTVLGSIDESNPGALSKSQLDNYIKSGWIEYAGQVSNVAEWIAKSHVFVLPSYREGVPRSTQEAMAIGRPIITTDVPGCRETVENGINGFLVPRWNSEILAEKMIYFIKNPEQIRIMGQESYRIAKDKFDSRKVNARLLKMMGL